MDIKPSYNRFLVLVVCVVCSGIMPQLFFKNGFLLSYLLRLGIGSADVLIMLSTLSAIMFCMSVPFAFYADRYGKKTIGLLGSGLMVTGYVIIILAGFSWPLSPFILVFSGIILYSCGLSAQLSGWFALLDPLIPGSVKGSFFGTLRASWQVFAIGCSSLLTYMIRAWDSISAFQVLLGGFTLLLALQALLYMKIPEIHSPKRDGRSLLRILGRFPGLPGYMPFCAYCFLLMVGAGSWPATLGLLEKNVLGFTDDTIVTMGTALFAGSLAGFYAGGKLVDRFGTKVIFLGAHFSYFLFFSLVVVRGMIPLPLAVFFGGITFFLGMIQAASSIAITSEMLMLAPRNNKSVMLSICTSLQMGGAALSGILSGKLIELDILAPTWHLAGSLVSNYDTLILGYAVLILLLVVTLGLIPSVVPPPSSRA